MTPPLSDRRRVERLLITGLFAGVVRDGTRNLAQADSETAEAFRLLGVVEAELCAGIDDRRAAIIDRVRRADRVFDRYRRPGTPVAEFGLLAYHLARILIDHGAFTIGPGSPLDQALDRLLPALADAAVEQGAFVAAEERAWAALGRLREIGYFADVVEAPQEDAALSTSKEG